MRGIMWNLFRVDFAWTYFKLNVSTYAEYLVKKIQLIIVIVIAVMEEIAVLE